MDIFSENEIIIYHGSNSVRENPTFGLGKKHNDYGLGFYCTRDVELAKEWAVDLKSDGYVNSYKLNLEGLKILDLQEHNPLVWLAILIKHRTFSIESGSLAETAYEYLISKYYIDVEEFDVIVGYRADDSYFMFASAFLSNTLSLENLTKALMFGGMGLQYTVKSKVAFERLTFECADNVLRSAYYVKKINRDTSARADYKSLSGRFTIQGTYILDIMRNDMTTNTQL